MEDTSIPNTIKDRFVMTKTKISGDKNLVDVHVGLRIRLRRQAMKLSQEQLANSLGISFQQVQKYENGSNRVSASRLYNVAQTLGTPVSYFFDGLTESGSSSVADSGSEFVYDFFSTQDGMAVATNFPRIKSARARKRIIDLIRELADEQD